MRPKGWRGDSARHSLAAKGIKTGRRPKSVDMDVFYDFGDPGVLEAKGNLNPDFEWYQSPKASTPKFRWNTTRLSTGYPYHAGVHTNNEARRAFLKRGGVKEPDKKYTAWFGIVMSGGGWEEYQKRHFDKLSEAKAWVEHKLKLKESKGFPGAK